MSPGWGHLITGMDPSVGHLNSILARVGGNLNNNFQKSQMPEGVARQGGDFEILIKPIHKSEIPRLFLDLEDIFSLAISWPVVTIHSYIWIYKILYSVTAKT